MINPFIEFKFSNRSYYKLLSGDSHSVKLSDYSDEEIDQLLLKTFNTLYDSIVGNYKRGIFFFVNTIDLYETLKLSILTVINSIFPLTKKLFY